MGSISNSESFRNIPESFPPVDSVLPEEVADTLEMLWIHLLREIGDECGCHKFPDWGYFNSGVWPKGDYG